MRPVRISNDSMFLDILPLLFKVENFYHIWLTYYVVQQFWGEVFCLLTKLLGARDLPTPTSTSNSLSNMRQHRLIKVQFLANYQKA